MDEKICSIVEVVMCPVAQSVDIDKSQVDSSSSRMIDSGMLSYMTAVSRI